MFGGFFDKLKDGLAKTRNSITEKVSEVLNLAITIDDELYEELEEILITSDIGVDTSVYVIEKLRKRVKELKIKDPSEIIPCLKEVLMDILGEEEDQIKEVELPRVILVIGVNGVGKTTSIGKIASSLKSKKYKVLIAAADTFRAAAIDQLEIWSSRADVPLIKHQEGSDPAAVVFDAVQAAKARKVDVLICDTAGRLHNKKNLMDELAKINRVIIREYSEAHIETLLVIDATTGQNGIQQAKQFMEICPIDGIILTKLDGTAKGGVVISIKNQLNIPVKYIGVGEGVDDLQEFNSRDFIEALF
ncbi:signal recognition particle-docking protein FtsY [Clostridium estertheticum]|uniref:Signal recognition particle receptor FtsY n=2 Tax=Clostridium estertheticum TaxID=238834 RepID=A0A1J0GI06_9CLOT|nr:signal recognition particle-docking protein FtsY [Clostridium estertheticum]APC40947.1 signal recognition particle-docking protein FtsY [Clostridium estertheticum subsp. estertheticum]MBU3170039.1 signal recognition particle-docking protein FtsY [Clostridium estertheticum]MBZ9617186.1 signal recognition particle-docking protein FtsY [Clostridium estertheticum subsp. laramiense]MPQ32328.1 signal recognition particle-docking protein FtsY [Clostridium estertheticum]MPQ62987.1 signal recognitio